LDKLKLVFEKFGQVVNLSYDGTSSWISL